ncbi:MAG: ATP-binding cassette domain-containing protein [Myxococcales bacterium]|nr:ATP-binding cassette domain-containing protein [Myxococcales bacterium]
MIELHGVRKVFPGPAGEPVIAVDDVTLRVARAEVLCIIGTSGCGKTTTMKMINRLVEPTEGAVRVDGQDVRALDPIRLRRSIGYVIQRGGLFPHRSVADNVGLLCRLEGWDPARTRERVAALLELVGLPADDFGRRYPRELSGGQQQRVGVARALALDPPVVLMDEPFGALDPITRAQLQREFAELRARLGKTIVMVTHDLEEAFTLGTRVALMDRGRLVQVGTEAELRDRPAAPFVREFLQRHRRGGHA